MVKKKAFCAMYKTNICIKLYTNGNKLNKHFVLYMILVKETFFSMQRADGNEHQVGIAGLMSLCIVLITVVTCSICSSLEHAERSTFAVPPSG